ncbi:MAG TPA: hypothetical protein VFP23_10300 [Solirubrobacterales bacterium]|nr:hypothetical protein [Solirubrobacterales bacterium]
MGREGRGAYGFRLVLPAHETELPDLSPLNGDAVSVALECRHASVLVERDRMDADCVSLGTRGSSLLEVRREPAAIVLELPEETTPAALVHPVLTAPISILARWRGDLTLHAGAFFADGRAWAVIGEREAGKSTALAMLAERGCPLLADDLLVLDGGVVRAGPACIDLRPDAAERMPGARYLGEIGNRPRHRLAAPHGPARAPLGGFFLLGWGEQAGVTVEPVPTGEALRVVYEQEYIGLMGPADPQKILDLLGMPMWRVRRPPDWARGEEAIDAILAVTAGAGP